MGVVKFITKYTTLWVILGAAVAFVTPETFKGFGGTIPFLLGIIMLSMGLSMTPGLLMLYVGKYMPIDAVGLFMSIIKVVIVPIVLGLLIHRFFDKYMDTINTVVPVASVVSVVFIIAVVVSLNVERLNGVAEMAFLACVLYTSAGMAIGYIISRLLRLPVDKRKAYTFVCGVQQTALSVTLAITYFDPISAIPPAILSVWTTVFGTLVASVWKSRTKPADDTAAAQ